MRAAIRVATLAAVAAASWGQVPESAPLVAAEGEFVSERGYVGSERCRGCHEQKHASWYRSFHRTMTQRVRPESVLADFGDVRLPLSDGVYRLTRRGDQIYATLPDGVERRIAQSTGSHHYQLYWYETGVGRELALLQAAWLISEGRWVPRSSLFLAPPENEQVPRVWNHNCLQCHATDAQPAYRPRADGRAVAETRVGELGIACEACHGPGREHVETQAAADVVHPGRLPAERSAEVCGQCHSVNTPYTQEAWADWLLDGPSFRPGDRLADSRYLADRATLSRSPLMTAWTEQDPKSFDTWFWPDGEVRVAGREFSALRRSPCYRGGGISCLSCHSPHADDPDDLLTVPRDGDEGCTQCHDGFVEPKRLEAHTRHRADSAGSRCYNCHMPNTVYGLLKATRSHEITNPTVASDLRAGRPNACSLCHSDRPLGWVGERLAEWYGASSPKLSEEQQTVAAGPLGLLTGDAGQRALWAWHFGWRPARQAAGTSWQGPLLAATLDDPYAVVRAIAARSLRTLPGYEAVRFDFVAPEAERAAAAKRARAIQPSGDPPATVPLDRIEELLRRRDDRPVVLAE